MNLEHLTIFLQVAQTGSFAAVARMRDADPSSISRAIAQLEADLGIRLFQRSTRQLHLTDAGTLYRAKTEPIVEELTLAKDEAANLGTTPSGTLRLSASVAFGTQRLVPMLREFRRAYPNLSIDLILSDDPTDMITERIDLAIRLGPELQGNFIATKLMQTHYRVVASPGWLETADKPHLPNDLATVSCLRFPYPGFRTEWMFKSSNGQIETVPISGDITISSALALKDAALMGLGPALLADWMVKDHIEAGTLTDLFPKYEVAATTFDTAAWLIYPSRTFLPNKVRIAIDFLKQRVAPIVR